MLRILRLALNQLLEHPRSLFELVDSLVGLRETAQRGHDARIPLELLVHINELRERRRMERFNLDDAIQIVGRGRLTLGGQ